MIKSICCDFDGVIHWYREGWKDGQIYDEPVPGAFEWLTRLVNNNNFRVYIYSSRSKTGDGIRAMANWFRKHGMVESILEQIEFPSQKPPAWLTIDDRAICFRGEFPSTAEIEEFRTWTQDTQ